METACKKKKKKRGGWGMASVTASLVNRTWHNIFLEHIPHVCVCVCVWFLWVVLIALTAHVTLTFATEEHLLGTVSPMSTNLKQLPLAAARRSHTSEYSGLFRTLWLFVYGCGCSIPLREKNRMFPAPPNISTAKDWRGVTIAFQERHHLYFWQRRLIWKVK